MLWILIILGIILVIMIPVAFWKSNEGKRLIEKTDLIEFGMTKEGFLKY